MTKGIRIVCFLLLIVVSLSTRSQTIVLTAVGDPWPVLLNPDTKEQGLLTEIVRKAYKTQGYDLKIKFVPWSRAMVMIQQKQADLLIGAWYTEERNDYLLYSDIIFSSALSFVKLKDSPFEYEGLASLKGKRVGTILGYQYGNDFLRDPNIIRITSDSILINIHNVIAERINLALDDHYVVKFMLDQHIKDWKSQLSIVKKPLTDKDLFLAANRSNPQHKVIINAFNMGLAQLKETGRYAEIVRSYNLDD